MKKLLVIENINDEISMMEVKDLEKFLESSFQHKSVFSKEAVPKKNMVTLLEYEIKIPKVIMKYELD